MKLLWSTIFWSYYMDSLLEILHWNLFVNIHYKILHAQHFHNSDPVSLRHLSRSPIYDMKCWSGIKYHRVSSKSAQAFTTYRQEPIFVRVTPTLWGAYRLDSREQKPEWKRQGVQVVFACLSLLFTFDCKQNNRCIGHARPTSCKFSTVCPSQCGPYALEK